MKPLKVALIQQAPIFFNEVQTTDLACDLIREHARQEVELIVFPETWLSGYPAWLDLAPGVALWDEKGADLLYNLLHKHAIEIGDGHLQKLSEAVQAAKMTIVIGAHERIGKSLYNTQFTLTQDGQIRPHRKLTPTYTERLIWGVGDGSTLSAVKTPFGILGGLICWEHWMPLARAAMQAQNETVHVAQWPEVNDLHRLASRHYAFEGGCFVLASGCYFTKGDVLNGLATLPKQYPEVQALLATMPGDNSTVLRRGLSAIYAPDGSVVSEEAAGPQTLVAELDLESLMTSRIKLDSAGHYARPDVFHLQVDTRAKHNVSFADPTR